ncbi:hypothetical protein DC094_15490 [Pelagibaculum spongiae]|uniref:Cell division protein ZipA n=2 Tax=Pelagibaculum spongiae TaxID=2080658 RepID=A0A2V1GTT4_9GAMM|nr:hypothetical protein DC094_15490 [Pelagibaculum spongiae]
MVGLFDALRRWRKATREDEQIDLRSRAKFDLSTNGGAKEASDPFDGVLGPARPVKSSPAADASMQADLQPQTAQSAAEKRPSARPATQPSLADFDAEAVKVHKEPVFKANAVNSAASSEKARPASVGDSVHHEPTLNQFENQHIPASLLKQPSEVDLVEPVDDDPAENLPLDTLLEDITQQSDPADRSEPTAAEPIEPTFDMHKELDQTENTPDTACDEVREDQQYQVLMIHLATRGNGISGKALLLALEREQLQFGEMNIFHSHQDDDPALPIMFSLVNSMQPGNFDLDTMDQLITPSVTMFVQIPGPSNPRKAVWNMLETADRMAKQINADLLDCKRMPMKQDQAARMLDEAERLTPASV